MPDERAIVKSPASQEIQVARERASALMEILEHGGLYQKIGEKRFLRVEGWQTIGRFDGATARTEWTTRDEDGITARVAIMKGGHEIGGAESFCGFDEYVCQGKDGSAKINAAVSMAQTRATSKAFRLLYSFVATLAGFEPTPAEEIATEPPGPGPMGECPDGHGTFRQITGEYQAHHKPVKAGRAKVGDKYSFWGCGNRQCKKKPEDWLRQEITKLGLKPDADGKVAGAIAQALGINAKDIATTPYRELVERLQAKLAPEPEQPEPVGEEAAQ